MTAAAYSSALARPLYVVERRQGWLWPRWRMVAQSEDWNAADDAYIEALRGSNNVRIRQIIHGQSVIKRRSWR